MDNSDNLSNVSDDSSRTNLSNLSGLTGYESEVNNIRCLLTNGTQSSVNSNTNVRQIYRTKSEDALLLEDHVKNLTNELQNCLKLNEKYKNRLFDLEHKTELMQHDKFEKLLKENTSLRLQLKNANCYVEKLLVKKNVDKLQNGVLNLEKSNYEKLQHMQREYNNCKDENNQLKVNYDRLFLEQTELRLDIESKVCCIKELKRKIAEQHVQYQNLLQEDLLNKNQLDNLRNNLEHSIKSEKWYKDQLHDCQMHKIKVYEEWSKLKSLVVNKDYQIQTLTQETEKFKLKCQNIEYNATKERQDFLYKFDLMKRELASNTNCNFNIIEASLSENEINDLKKDVEIIQSNMSEAYVLLNDSNKKNAQIAAEKMILHKTLMQKLLLLETSEGKSNELQKKLDSYMNRVKIAEDELISLKCEKSKLEIAVSVAKKEKLDVDDSIANVKEMFSKFLQVYKSLKEELACKTRELLKLQTEKQQLFMSNNWHICEIESIKKEFAETNKKNQALVEENSKLICEFYSLKSANNNLRRELNELNDKYVKIEETNLRFVAEAKAKEMQEDFTKYDEAVIKALLDYFMECINYLQKINTRNEVISLGNVLKEQNIILHHSDETINKFDDGIKYLAQYLRGSSDEIKTIYNENKTLQKKLSAINKHLVPKANLLQKRVEDLESNVGKSMDLLQNKINTNYKDVNMNVINQAISEEMKNLRALVKVKDLEKKEKEKRYDANVRTLLKKVKEHLRGRNAVEKENKVLKELYEAVLEESNNLKFENNNRRFDAEKLARNVTNLKEVNEKLRQNVIDAETKLSEETVGKLCEGCEGINTIVLELDILRKEKESVEDQLRFYTIDLNEKKIAFTTLQTQLQNYHLKLLKQEDEINTYKAAETTDKEQLLQKEQLVKELAINNDALKGNSNKLQNDLHNLYNEISKCKLDLNEVNSKNLILSEMNDVFGKELELSKIILLERNNEIDQLKSQRDDLLKDLKQNDLENQELINKLKNDMNELKEQLQLSMDETLFLKRLNNDMKYALTTLSNQNKSLTRQLHNNSKEEFHSVPSNLLNIPSPNKLDETFINNLLKNNNNERPKPLTELQRCLKSLKKEMSNLQEEIVQKSFVSFDTS